MDTGSPQLYIHLIIAALELSLPGTAFYLLARQLLDRDARVDLVHAVMFGALTSIAIWPLLLLYTSLIGLHFAPLYVWAVLVVSALYIAYRGISAGKSSITLMTGRRITGLAIGGMTLFSLAFRLGDIQGLAVPMFGDSLHHTMITTIILNTGQFPRGYAPFVPVDTFTYHFGFHTLAAVFAMLTGSSATYSVLLVSQFLNALAVPAAFVLNRQIFNSRLAGLGAALVTGFVSLMPAFYVNWGRDTQLAGQVLLLAGLTFVVRAMSTRWKRSDIALTALCVAGLVVVHYRVLIFFGLFGLALGAWQIVRWWRQRRVLFHAWGHGLLAVVIGLVVASPWLLNLFTNYFPGLTHRLSTVTADYLAEYNNPGTISFYTGNLVPALGLAGTLIGIGGLVMLRRHLVQGTEEGTRRLDTYFMLLVLALWMGFLVLSLWIVPGAIGSYTVAITLYIPLSALGGYAIAWVLGQASDRMKVPAPGFALVMLIAAPILAMLLGTDHVGNPAQYNYVHQPDLDAFDWIRNNTPTDAKFLISSEFSYKGRAVTATDAGMWLPILANRNVSVPALSAWMEQPVSPTFFTDTKQLAAYTQPITGTDGYTQPQLASPNLGIIPAPHTLSDPEPLALMKEFGITYVYSGAVEGASKTRLDIADLRRDSTHYKLVYFARGVYIFQVIY